MRVPTRVGRRVVSRPNVKVQVGDAYTLSPMPGGAPGPNGAGSPATGLYRVGATGPQPSRVPGRMTDVVVAGGSEETRLLLRGLLRLHHHRVVADGFPEGSEISIPPGVQEPVLILEADLAKPECRDIVLRVRSARPDLKIVLLTANRSTDVAAKAAALGIDSILRRPFAVRELIDAVGGPGPLPPIEGEPGSDSPSPNS